MERGRKEATLMRYINPSVSNKRIDKPQLSVASRIGQSQSSTRPSQITLVYLAAPNSNWASSFLLLLQWPAFMTTTRYSKYCSPLPIRIKHQNTHDELYCTVLCTCTHRLLLLLLLVHLFWFSSCTRNPHALPKSPIQSSPLFIDQSVHFRSIDLDADA